MKHIKYQEFIGMYENVYEHGYCQHLIEEFDRLSRSGISMSRKSSENVKKTFKDDYQIFDNDLTGDTSLMRFGDKDALSIFWRGLQDCFDNYVSQYDILSEFDIRCQSVKMQKTNPGSGYHIWHSEQAPNEYASRCLVYILYLNTIDSAGETEFLYQRLRIPPKENCMVIWPATFTHTHRGNVVHGNKSKYIVTGWFNLH